MTKAANRSTGVSYTGAEVYVNGSNRSPFDTNFGNFGPRLGFSWQVADNLVFNGSAGIYYGPSTQMVGSASLNSDGFASYTSWNATCFTDAGNTIVQRHQPLLGSARRQSRPKHDRNLLAQQSFPQRSRPHVHHSAAGTGQQSGHHAEHRAALAAHAHRLQLQLRLAI